MLRDWGVINKIYWDYVASLYQDIPIIFIETLIIIFALGCILLIAIKGIRRGVASIKKLLLIEYLLLLYCSTVIFRSHNHDQAYNLHPLWSYFVILSGEYTAQLPEKLMNLVVFMPLGFLLHSALEEIKWWHTLIVGFLISVSIEILQFMLKRGFAEFDDVLHNTVGCIIGYGLYNLLLKRSETKN